MTIAILNIQETHSNPLHDPAEVKLKYSVSFKEYTLPIQHVSYDTGAWFILKLYNEIVDTVYDLEQLRDNSKRMRIKCYQVYH